MFPINYLRLCARSRLFLSVSLTPDHSLVSYGSDSLTHFDPTVADSSVSTAFICCIDYVYYRFLVLSRLVPVSRALLEVFNQVLCEICTDVVINENAFVVKVIDLLQ